MKPAYFRALLAGGLMASSTALAAQGDSDPGSELRLSPLSLHETRTLPAGSAELGAQAELLRYNHPDSSTSVTDLDLTPEFAFGITDALEIGLSGPYRSRVDENQGGGWRHIAGRITYRFLELEKRASALTLQGSALNDNSDAQVASGRTTYTAEWHMSGYSDTGAAHFALGYSERDYPLVQEEPVYENETEYYAQWGFGYLLAPELAFTGELSFDYGVQDEQGSLEIMPGFRYTEPESRYSVAMGLGFRPGTDDFRPNSRVMLTLTYRPAGTATLRDRVDTLEQQVGSLRGKVEGLSQQLAKKPADKAQDPEPKPASELRKETAGISLGLVNASGEKGLAEDLSDRLRQMGYEVIQVSRAEGPVQSVTHLYYREGFNKAAVTLGRALPETQTLTHYTHLPDGVDIQLVVGADQIDSAMRDGRSGADQGRKDMDKAGGEDTSQPADQPEPDGGGGS
jgi:hypothetical protein